MRSYEGLLLAVVFAIAHTQSPLFFSNQNQYLLHGAASAHDGQLAEDWLAQTRDPAPGISYLFHFCFSVHPAILHGLHFILLMAYFLLARRIAQTISDTRHARLTFAVAFTVIHSGFIRWLSIQVTGTDYPWYFQAGLASQYLVGPGIQPSAIGGVFLFASIFAMFEKQHPEHVTLLVALACLCHSTYLLPGGLIVACYLLVQARQGKSIRTLAMAAFSSLLLASIPIAFAIRDFLWEADGRAEAMRILAEVRIPHHCQPARWFDWIAGLQIAWMALGLWLARKTDAGRTLTLAAAICALLTLLQIVTGSHALALLFPWRISVLLVPLTTCLLFARLPVFRPWVAIASLVALAASGIVVMAMGLGYRMVDEEWPLYRQVRATVKPGEVYFVPAVFPKVSTGRGAVSNTFTAPARIAQGTNQIPVDLQRFRLAAGAPIFVDFKSVPYAVKEVLEWNRRMTLADSWTRNPNWNSAERIDAMRAEGITHLVVPASIQLTNPAWVESYRDEAYRVARLE